MNIYKKIIITFLGMLYMQNSFTSFQTYSGTLNGYSKWAVVLLAGAGAIDLLRDESSIIKSYWHKFQMAKFVKAAGEGDIETVKDYLKSGYNPFEGEKDYGLNYSNNELLTMNSPAHEAIKNGQLITLECILSFTFEKKSQIPSYEHSLLSPYRYSWDFCRHTRDALHLAVLIENCDAAALILKYQLLVGYRVASIFLDVAYQKNNTLLFRTLFEALPYDSSEIMANHYISTWVDVNYRFDYNTFIFKSIRDDRFDILKTILQSNQPVSAYLILGACALAAHEHKSKALQILLNYCIQMIRPSFKILCSAYPYTFIQALRDYNARKKNILKGCMKSLKNNIDGDGNITKLIWNYTK